MLSSDSLLLTLASCHVTQSYQKAQGIIPCVLQSLAGFMPKHPTRAGSQQAAWEMFYCPTIYPFWLWAPIEIPNANLPRNWAYKHYLIKKKKILPSSPPHLLVSSAFFQHLALYPIALSFQVPPFPPPNQIFPEIHSFLLPSWISAGAAQNIGQCLPCCAPQATVLHFYNKGTQKHDEGLVLDALQRHRENAQTSLTPNTHSLELQQEVDPPQQQ